MRQGEGELREKCSDTEFFSGSYFPAFEMNTETLYSVRMRRNTDQKKTPYLDTFDAVGIGENNDKV